jgi:hypothetical protein
MNRFKNKTIKRQKERKNNFFNKNKDRKNYKRIVQLQIKRLN